MDTISTPGALLARWLRRPLMRVHREGWKRVAADAGGALERPRWLGNVAIS
jgi:hypothetical protein